MGCVGGQNTKLQIIYCQSCGWSKVAKKVIDAIRQKHSNVSIDCHPANGYTGLLQIYQLVDNKKKQLFSGSKDETMVKIKQIPSMLQT